MRSLVRPFLLFALLCGVTTASQSQPAPGGAINVFVWTQGFPAATEGGVDVSVDVTPAAGWSCTDVTLRVVDAGTNKTLGEYNTGTPGAAVSHSFAGIDNRLKVRVTGDAVFQNAGAFDNKQIQGYANTK